LLAIEGLIGEGAIVKKEKNLLVAEKRTRGEKVEGEMFYGGDY
jgi:hypothetical protein